MTSSGVKRKSDEIADECAAMELEQRREKGKEREERRDTLSFPAQSPFDLEVYYSWELVAWRLRNSGKEGPSQEEIEQLVELARRKLEAEAEAQKREAKAEAEALVRRIYLSECPANWELDLWTHYQGALAEAVKADISLADRVKAYIERPAEWVIFFKGILNYEHKVRTKRERERKRERLVVCVLFPTNTYAYYYMCVHICMF